MTWITDNTGTRWVPVPEKKRRKPGQPRRFANINVGDQIMLKPNKSWYRGIPTYFLVTDLWFDPVAGQDDPVKGQMVGFAQIKPDGELAGKCSTPIRGLASQQYEYADIDYVALCKQRLVAMDAKTVVGIGHGRVIRQRPKLPGHSL